MVDRFYTWATSHRTLILRLFWLVNILLVLLIGVGFRTIVFGIGNPEIFTLIGSKAADVAVLFLVVSCIPGIARRVQYQHKLIMLCMLFRRQLGIAVFFFALVHVCFITVFPEIHAHAPLITTDLQNLAGWATFILLIPLFLTSNNESIRELGIWWHRLHVVVYGIVWILVIHTFFSGESMFFLIGLAAAGEMGSFVYESIRKRKNVTSK